MGSSPSQTIILGYQITEEAEDADYTDENGDDISLNSYMYSKLEELNELYNSQPESRFELASEASSYCGEASYNPIIGITLKYQFKQILHDYGQEIIDVTQLYKDWMGMKLWLDNQPDLLKTLRDLAKVGDSTMPQFYAISSYG